MRLCVTKAKNILLSVKTQISLDFHSRYLATCFPIGMKKSKVLAPSEDLVLACYVCWHVLSRSDVAELLFKHPHNISLSKCLTGSQNDVKQTLNPNNNYPCVNNRTDDL